MVQRWFSVIIIAFSVFFHRNFLCRSRERGGKLLNILLREDNVLHGKIFFNMVKADGLGHRGKVRQPEYEGQQHLEQP